ncbi:type III secretion protein [Vibrio cholerae]|uniref:type III secretion protein n=1 Tax=Vibrio cholerae TaxID=666 RepID=UPI00208BED6C|nr:type III secretion protein [Vibrio cholerae]EGQ8442525.1 type III secretion protein [Vibrio cholerae]EGR1312102.1 type III secretion protein [Vibrio cholerae]MEB5517855.1 type III secretion protein [Vibrio cholerae]GIB52604.1 type III secretion protein [Vibrio cholerae]
MKFILNFFLCLLITACANEKTTVIGEFDSRDIANKVLVLLSNYDIEAALTRQKDSYIVSVNEANELNARIILTKYNFYFVDDSLNELLESKFSSLSKLETVKSNLLLSKDIHNKLSALPNVMKVSVIVNGEKNKRVAVMVMSIDELSIENKKNINDFLIGIMSETDTVTVKYFVHRGVNDLLAEKVPFSTP